MGAPEPTEAGIRQSSVSNPAPSASPLLHRR